MSNIKIVRNGLEIPFKSFVFPGGEIGVKLKADSVSAIAHTGAYASGLNPTQVIVARLKSANDIIELAMIKNALDIMFQGTGTKTTLFMPYVPYGRQDRLMCGGESFGRKY